MISCPDALFFRIKFQATYLGINLTETATGDTQNQRSCKKNSVAYNCEVGKNSTKMRYDNSGMLNRTKKVKRQQGMMSKLEENYLKA
jgi:hypothetical protein